MISELCGGIALLIIVIAVVSMLNTFTTVEDPGPVPEPDDIDSAELEAATEMQQVREQLAVLDARALEIRDSINQLLGYYNATYSGTVASAVEDANCACPDTSVSPGIPGARCWRCAKSFR